MMSVIQMQSIAGRRAAEPFKARGKRFSRGRIGTSPGTGSLTERMRCIARKLRRHYGLDRHGNKRAAIDDLFYILLSRQTNEQNFRTAYKKLRTRWPSWNSLATARASEIYRHIHVAGFGWQRAQEIKRISRRLSGDFGKVSLAPLSRMSTKGAEAYLTSLPGVGKKTARCVLMYALQRQVFPVDVHCFRTLNRLGLIGFGLPIRNHEDEIQRMIPPRLRLTLHVTLVSLGRDVCHAIRTECHRCPLRELCPSQCVVGRTDDRHRGALR